MDRVDRLPVSAVPASFEGRLAAALAADNVVLTEGFAIRVIPRLLPDTALVVSLSGEGPVDPVQLREHNLAFAGMLRKVERLVGADK